MNERLFGLLVVAALTSASAAAADPIQGSTGPAAVYSGGDILTMRGPAPEYVEALVVRDGRIAYAGNKAAPAAPAASASAMEDAHAQHERLHQLPPARVLNAREQATLATLVAAAEGG